MKLSGEVKQVLPPLFYFSFASGGYPQLCCTGPRSELPTKVVLLFVGVCCVGLQFGGSFPTLVPGSGTERFAGRFAEKCWGRMEIFDIS